MFSTLADYTSLELIIAPLSHHEPETGIAQLCELLKQSGRVSDGGEAYHAAINRELLSPTAMAPGWAIPHARLCGVSAVSFAVGRSAVPLTWFGQTPIKVTTIFLCVLPETDVGCYLALISGLARLSQDATRTQQLQTSFTQHEILSLLGQVQLRWPRPAIIEGRV